MNVRITPIAEVSERAYRVLVKELGIVDTLRYLNQFRSGDGDYTAERRAASTPSTSELIAAIKHERPDTAS